MNDDQRLTFMTLVQSAIWESEQSTTAAGRYYWHGYAMGLTMAISDLEYAARLQRLVKEALKGEFP